MLRNQVTLQKAVVETVKVTWPDGTEQEIQREAKPELRADKCQGCGQVFKMEPAHGYRTGLGEVRGIFSECADDPETGKGLGNMFFATVCSFACADKVMKGGWRDIDEYQPYADIDATLLRCECHITSQMKYEDDLVREWAVMPVSERTVRSDHQGVLWIRGAIDPGEQLIDGEVPPDSDEEKTEGGESP